MPVQTVYHVVPQKYLAFWTAAEVVEWLKRRRPKLALKFSDDLLRHYITGRVLMEITTDEDLRKVGIESFEERQDLLLEIRRVKLTSDLNEFQQLCQGDEQHNVQK